MEEFYNLIMIFIAVPMAFGIIAAIMLRKPRHYYKYEGYRWIRKR